MDDPTIDALYIPLPSALHLPWVKRAAAAGKHVLLEKPISVTAAEAEEMVGACRRAGVQLMDGTMWSHNPRAGDMAALIRSGRLGELRDVHTIFTFNASPQFLSQDVRMSKGRRTVPEPAALLQAGEC